MGKRAPILSQDYNPVGARLQKALAPVPEERPAPQITREVQTQIRREEPVQRSEKVVTSSQFLKAPPQPQERRIASPIERLEPIADAPQTKEMMITSLRARCTENERKKWHDFAKDVTGEHNQFSHVFRAMLLILENSHEHLMKLLPEMKGLKVPAKKDSMGIALYEQKLSQILWDAIKGAGRPRG